MPQSGKNVSTDKELSYLLNELSFSYMAVHSARQSLDDLNGSIRELEDLVDALQLQADELEL